jgi:hypothetical protein
MTPVSRRKLRRCATVGSRAFSWLGAALIVWGSAVAGVRNPNEPPICTARAAAQERRLRIQARRCIREVEEYLAGHNNPC